MRQRSPGRWETPFGRFVGNYGVQRLVQEFSRDPRTQITQQGVYNWIRGAAFPKPTFALRMVELYERRLRFEDIYAHRGQVQRMRAGRRDR